MVTEGTLIIGDSHVRPLKWLDLPMLEVLAISGATMSGTLNPASRTDARNLALSALQALQPKVVVFMLGEVDAGFLCPMKGAGDRRATMECIRSAVANYATFLNEVAALPYVKRVTASNIYPPIISDQNIKRSKIKLRRQVSISLRERRYLICQANTMIANSFSDVLDVHRQFLVRMATERYSHINRRDHHFSSAFYVKAMVEILGSAGLISKSVRVPGKSYFFARDVLSFAL